MSSNRSYSLSEMDGGGRLPDEPVEPASADRRREAPESAQDLRNRLERLPHGHPSSPYRDDGTRKPPPPDLTKLELPLPDEPAPEPSKIDSHTEPVDSKARTNPDGSWDWKGLHLTPERSRVADSSLAKRREAEGRDVDGTYGQHGLTPAMRRIESLLEHGQRVERTEEFALKSPDRFKEKLAKRIARYPNADVHDLANEIHDGIRYTFIYDFEKYTKGVEITQAKIAEAGYDPIETRPNWDGDEYKGVNSRWREPVMGVTFEVQFHTRSSWEAKQKTHQAYEWIDDPRTPIHEVERLRAYQREVCAGVPIPPGALEIPSYKKSRE